MLAAEPAERADGEASGDGRAINGAMLADERGGALGGQAEIGLGVAWGTRHGSGYASTSGIAAT